MKQLRVKRRKRILLDVPVPSEEVAKAILTAMRTAAKASWVEGALFGSVLTLIVSSLGAWVFG